MGKKMSKLGVELSIQKENGIERAIYTHSLEKHEVATRK